MQYILVNHEVNFHYFIGNISDGKLATLIDYLDESIRLISLDCKRLSKLRYYYLAIKDGADIGWTRFYLRDNPLFKYETVGIKVSYHNGKHTLYFSTDNHGTKKEEVCVEVKSESFGYTYIARVNHTRLHEILETIAEFKESCKFYGELDLTKNELSAILENVFMNLYDEKLKGYAILRDASNTYNT